jgi:hypothetical protein
LTPSSERADPANCARAGPGKIKTRNANQMAVRIFLGNGIVETIPARESHYKINIPNGPRVSFPAFSPIKCRAICFRG